MGVIRLGMNYPVIGFFFNILAKLVPSITRRRKESLALTEGKLQQRLGLRVDRKDFVAYVSIDRTIVSLLTFSKDRPRFQRAELQGNCCQYAHNARCRIGNYLHSPQWCLVVSYEPSQGI